MSDIPAYPFWAAPRLDRVPRRWRDTMAAEWRRLAGIERLSRGQVVGVGVALAGVLFIAQLARQRLRKDGAAPSFGSTAPANAPTGPWCRSIAPACPNHCSNPNCLATKKAPSRVPLRMVAINICSATGLPFHR